MKEIQDIVNAHKSARERGQKTALATVVHVEGSSYRSPGARMLVEENGMMTGAISGGCLEGDALRKAMLAMNEKVNKLVTYDTSDEDDAKFGVQLGCNGIVHILFEPIIDVQENNPIVLLEHVLTKRTDSVLVTTFSLERSSSIQPGTCLFYDGQKNGSSLEDYILEAELIKEAGITLASKNSSLQHYPERNLQAFVELRQPPISLIIFGAGNDAIPLVAMARVLGWQITIVDGRPTHANRQRFGNADQVLVGKPNEVLDKLIIDARTAIVVMTHNYNYDLELVRILLGKECNYIGTLGPHKRIERIFTELEEQGIEITRPQRSRIYGPVGLNIGAETAEEIALSILSEIQAVFTETEGGSLRNKSGEVHDRAAVERKIKTSSL